MPVQSVLHLATVEDGKPKAFRRLTLCLSAAHVLHVLLKHIGEYVTDEVVLTDSQKIPARERPKCRVKPRHGN